MSEYEHHVGKLKKVERLNGENLDSLCERILENKGIEINLDSYYCPKEQIVEEYYEDYVASKNELYEILNYEKQDSNYYINLIKNIDGTINFNTRFYNGSDCLSNILEKGLEGLENLDEGEKEGVKCQL